jgi:hypothetical protein
MLGTSGSLARSGDVRPELGQGSIDIGREALAIGVSGLASLCPAVFRRVISIAAQG